MKYIELNTFLNIRNLATSGGDAKQKIRNEEIQVNGELETRNKKKLVTGDVITYQEQTYTVTEEEVR